mmetsp:Transcript_2278/g.3098  ORF Transcript_2278/g.3098 Transcript_2278/m.3098 type:complete len:209 (-) Transcript_2278:103-729(-)
MLFVAFNDASLNVMARTMKDVHYSLIQFWFGAIGLVILLAYFAIDCAVRVDWPTLFLYDSSQMLFLGLTGVFSALNLTCLTIAYQKDNSATVSLLAYIELVYAFISDVTIFETSFIPKELVGAAIITFFNVFTIWYKMKYAPDNSDSEGQNTVESYRHSSRRSAGSKKSYLDASEDSDEERLVFEQEMVDLSLKVPKHELDEEWSKSQ